jgi:RNA polymerase sigma-70 factor (ECF subfamily)
MRETDLVDELPENSVEGQALIARLLMKHRTDLFAYLLAAVRNAHDAEDLLQDVSLAASTSWAQYRPGTPFLAWAREIARRRVLDYGKKKSRRHALLEPDVLEALDAAAAAVEAEQPLEPRRDALRLCLQKVGGDARKIVELRYAEQADVSSIAREVGRSVQASYAILKRTKQLLRECIERRLSGAM